MYLSSFSPFGVINTKAGTKNKILKKNLLIKEYSNVKKYNKQKRSIS